MSNIAISAEHLGKQYRLNASQGRHGYVALRDEIAHGLRRALPFTRRRRHGGDGARPSTVQSGSTEFWALRDVTFEVNHGDVVGIIGRNGAGKSTLLKILSRITEPTEGRARLRGRVASLLEVGTGFHPELTGRENIFLNGAILGMTKAEIRKKFDEMVAFAEVERFLDTPVKRYSSGMYVRLAFAVAAHLEPEILVVDEVLSVGDVAFQMKCLGKMKNVSADGRTVLYVTHNLSSVVNLCRRGILLNGGKIVEDTTAERAVNSYLRVAFDNRTDEPHVLFVDPQPNGDRYCVTRIEMLDEDDRPKAILRPMEFVKFRVWFHSPKPLEQGSIIFELLTADGNVVLKLESNPRAIRPLVGGTGVQYADCCIESLPLMEGQYTFGVGLAIYGVRLLSWIPNAASLLISEQTLGSGVDMSVDRKGVMVVNHRWESGERVACSM
jgi:lipopolysaccharide transport system ATP-binding protein